MDLRYYIDKADTYAALRAYECIVHLRDTKELIIKNDDIKSTLILIDNNKIGFESHLATNKDIPQINIESVKHEFYVKSNDNKNAFEYLFESAIVEPFDELKESNDRNKNKLQMLKLFNTYLNLRIDNSVSKVLLPIYGNITQESEIEDLVQSDTRATVLVTDPRPQDKISQVTSIGNRIYDIFFGNDEIGTAKKVIHEALSDPQIKYTPALIGVFTKVISKYIADYDTFLENNNNTVIDMYNKIGAILSVYLKLDDIESSKLISLISDIIIILECIFLLSNDRYNVL
jgi:hypothetical protein